MSQEHISHTHIVGFADKAVNLPREDAQEYCDQVEHLGKKLEKYVKENQDFELRKILLSGSLAKRTALRTINDADVAVYVESAPEDVGELTHWLAKKLQTAFPNFNPDQVTVQTYSVRVDFRGSGLSVDVVPVYAEAKNKDGYGFLVSQEDGSKLRTNIPLHKKFIQTRNKNNPHYRQVVRLLKWWVKTRKAENAQFGFKSFMVELVLAKLVDEGAALNNYPEALLAFFDYVAKFGLSERIAFPDYAEESGIPGACEDSIQIFDPVNAENNVGRKYSDSARQVIVDECVDAGDAVEAALRAPTKSETLRYWRRVLGPSFGE